MRSAAIPMKVTPTAKPEVDEYVTPVRLEALAPKLPTSTSSSQEHTPTVASDAPVLTSALPLRYLTDAKIPHAIATSGAAIEKASGKNALGPTANGDGPVLEYDIDLSPKDGKGTVAIGILPTQDVYPARGLRLGVQIDDWPMATVDARQGFHDEFREYTPQNLAQSKKLKPLPPHNNLLLSGVSAKLVLTRIRSDTL